MEVFGFHDTLENLFNEDDYSFTENYYDAQNILNILGWIPAIGTVVGCVRIGSTLVMYIEDNESHRANHRKYYVVSVLRGLVEFFSLGLVMIIPDIYATLKPKRRFKKLRKWRRKK